MKVSNPKYRRIDGEKNKITRKCRTLSPSV